MNQQLVGKHLIVQCEQGVDMFTQPISELLQDNFEDDVSHHVCMEYVEAEQIQSLLIQINPELDLSRGIDHDELEDSIFGEGKLQMNAFNQCMTFKSVEASAPPPTKLLDLAVKLGGVQHKSTASVNLLGFDPKHHVVLRNVYAGYMAFSAAESDASVPVAGVLEIIAELFNSRVCNMPWSFTAEPPSQLRPMWMLARFLTQWQDHVCSSRVLTQFCDAGMHQAKTYADFLFYG